MEKQLLELVPITEAYEAEFAAHSNMPYRVQTVAMRLIRMHAEYCRGYAKAMAIKCLGKDAEAKAFADQFLKEFGRYEVAIERYYDHMISTYALRSIFSTKSEYAQ